MHQYKLYTDLSLTMDKFIACVCDQQYSVLIIEGSPTPKELEVAWYDIYLKYLDLNEDAESIYLFLLQKEILLLEQKVSEVETSTFLLAFQYRKELVEIIERNGYTISLDLNDSEKYHQALAVVRAYLAPAKMELDAKKHELQQYHSDREQGTIDRTYFTKTLLRLARYQRAGIIKPENITVEEFSLLTKEYVEHLSSNQKTLDQDGEAW